MDIVDSFVEKYTSCTTTEEFFSNTELEFCVDWSKTLTERSEWVNAITTLLAARARENRNLNRLRCFYRFISIEDAADLLNNLAENLECFGEHLHSFELEIVSLDSNNNSSEAGDSFAHAWENISNAGAHLSQLTEFSLTLSSSLEELVESIGKDNYQKYIKSCVIFLLALPNPTQLRKLELSLEETDFWGDYLPQATTNHLANMLSSAINRYSALHCFSITGNYLSCELQDNITQFIRTHQSLRTINIQLLATHADFHMLNQALLNRNLRNITIKIENGHANDIEGRPTIERQYEDLAHIIRGNNTIETLNVDFDIACGLEIRQSFHREQESGLPEQLQSWPSVLYALHERNISASICIISEVHGNDSAIKIENKNGDQNISTLTIKIQGIEVQDINILKIASPSNNYGRRNLSSLFNEVDNHKEPLYKRPRNDS